MSKKKRAAKAAKAAKKAVGKHVKTSAKFGFHAWNLDAMQIDQEAYQKFIGKMIREGIELATEEYECRAYFPIEYNYRPEPDDGNNGKAVDDPTIIYVELPLGPNDMDEPMWSFCLTEMIDNMIEMVERGEGGPIDKEDTPPLVAVRDALRMLANRIDARLPA